MSSLFVLRRFPNLTFVIEYPFILPVYFQSVIIVGALFFFIFALTKGTFCVGKDIKCLYGAYDCGDCCCRVAFSDCDVLRQKRKAGKEDFKRAPVLKPYLDLTVPTPIYPFQAQKGNEHNAYFVFGNTYICDQNRSFVFRSEQNNDGRRFYTYKYCRKRDT